MIITTCLIGEFVVPLPVLLACAGCIEVGIICHEAVATTSRKATTNPQRLKFLKCGLHSIYQIILQSKLIQTNIILMVVKKQLFRVFVTISQPANENHNLFITKCSLQPFSTRSM